MSSLLASGVIIASGVWLILVSALMLARPAIALQYLAKMASTNLINYSELSLRLIWGIAMIAYSDSSRFPEFFRIAGWVLAGTAIVLMLVPRQWHAAYAVYWSKKLTAPLVRLFAPISLLFGIFLIWAVI